MRRKSSLDVARRYTGMKHIDAALHTRGESQYVDDVPPPAGMLQAAIFGSPIAHGTIKQLDVSTALKADGVVAILTAADIPGENQIGSLIQDEELLASKTVHFHGQSIAIVIAETAAQARKARTLIKIKLDPLPVITDPKVAYKKGSIIGTPRTFMLGDVEAAWDNCAHVLEGSCDIGGQEHVYLETQRARAVPLEDGNMRIYSSTQSPYVGQKIAARILGVPLHKIEVDVKRLGGGFGGKEDQATPYACMAALAAWKTGQAVELVLNREEDLKMTGKRHPYRSDFRIGFSREGKILAYDVQHYQNSGAAADLSPPVLERTLFHSTNSYYIPNVKIFGICCRTNLPPNTAFRGFGGPQGMFVIESALQMVADHIGKPREEIQRINLLQPGDFFPYGQQVEENNVCRTWDEAWNIFKFKKRRKKIQRFNESHFEQKKGIAIMPVTFGISFTATFMNQASALLHVYTDGSVSVTTGGIEMGQGLSTNIASIVARTFGIAPERIKVESTNTTRIANMSPSAASATTLLNGNAAQIGATQILDRLKHLAAGELGIADIGNLELVEEQLLHNGHDTGWRWEELVSKAYFSRIALSSHAFYATPDIFFDKQREKGRPFAYHTHGAAMIEVTVDCLRGSYEVDAVRIVHDLGRPINDLVDLGQVEGGLAQGLGWMTMEDLQFNEEGKLLSHALATYKVPDVYFMPDKLDVHFLENAESKLGPYGSKAVGEPPLMYGIGVWFAIREAMKAFRPQAKIAYDTPMTPERVLVQLYEKEIAELQPADLRAK